MHKRKFAIVGAILSGLVLFSACSSDADTASYNIGEAAEAFEVQRRIVFINGITDKYLFTVEGRCSVETTDSALGGSIEVTCKIGPDEFKKHFLGLADNVTYVVEQQDAIDVSEFHHRVIFKPESIVPEIDVVTSD